MEIIEIAMWSAFESLVSTKHLLMQYEESETFYEIYAPEAQTFLWHISLAKGSTDGNDFETNHKPTSNKPLDVRAGPGRPPRVCVSPQPDGTYWNTKGYELVCGSSDSSAELDISFASKIYLLGGHILSDDAQAGDTFTGAVQMQIGGNWTTIMTPIDGVYILPGKRESVISDECMEFLTTYRLKITYTPAQTGTARKVYVRLEFFK